MQGWAAFLFASVRKGVRNTSGFRLLITYLVWSFIVDLIIFYYTSGFVDHDLFTGRTGGVDYFSFVITGYIFADLFATITTTPYSIVSTERIQGTFETALVAPRSLYGVIMAASAFDLAKALLRISILVTCSVFIGYRFPLALPGAAALAGVFLVVSLLFGGISMVFCGLFLIERRFAYLAAIYLAVSTVLAGTLFPIAVFPDWLQNLSGLLPFTAGLQCVRSVQTGHFTLEAVLPLLIAAVVMLPVSIWLFNVCARYARRTGRILSY